MGDDRIALFIRATRKGGKLRTVEKGLDHHGISEYVGKGNSPAGCIG